MRSASHAEDASCPTRETPISERPSLLDKVRDMQRAASPLRLRCGPNRPGEDARRIRQALRMGILRALDGGGARAARARAATDGARHDEKEGLARSPSGVAAGDAQGHEPHRAPTLRVPA